MSQPGQFLLQTGLTLKDQAKFSVWLIPLFVIMVSCLPLSHQTILCFLSFRAPVFDTVFLRAPCFISACFGFAKLVEIDRFDQA